MVSNPKAMASNLMASNLIAMASNLIARPSNLLAMASNLVAMVSNLIAMASNLVAMACNLEKENARQTFCNRNSGAEVFGICTTSWINERKMFYLLTAVQPESKSGPEPHLR